MRRAAAAGFGAVLVSGGLFLSDPRRRRRAVRGADFWRRAFPMYCRYRYEEWRVHGRPEAEREAAFDCLHEKYAKKAYEDIIAMRGLYIKVRRAASRVLSAAGGFFFLLLFPGRISHAKKFFSWARL